jgi:hypothetical protein
MGITEDTPVTSAKRGPSSEQDKLPYGCIPEKQGWLLLRHLRSDPVLFGPVGAQGARNLLPPAVGPITSIPG